MQSLYFSGYYFHGEVLTPLSSDFMVHYLLLVAAAALAAVLLVGRWWCQQHKYQEVVRSITGTFCRHSLYHRPVEDAKCDHSGILLNAALLSIMKHAEDKKGQALRAKRDTGKARDGHGKRAVVFLFDPLKSDAELTVGRFSFDCVGFFCPSVALRFFNLQGVLRRHKVAHMATGGSWMSVSDGIDVTYQRYRKDEPTTQIVDHVLHLRAKGPDAAERLHQFVDHSLKDYIEDLTHSLDHVRYHFRLVDGERRLRFRRTTLSTCKSFATLFFPQKEALLRRLQQFHTKQGRFAVEGIPYKMGFLVYGGAGTGKTSVVSAMAAYTGRHVISLYLPLLTADEQLMDVFLSRTLWCVEEYHPFKFRLEDVIILFEDVSPDDGIIRCRQLSASQTTRQDEETYCSPRSRLSTQEGKGCEGSLPSLSALLNVIDGTVDMYSLIVVMTTRDPTGIDPALLRPGRFGYKICLQDLRLQELIELAGLYFGTVQHQSVESGNWGNDREPAEQRGNMPRQLDSVDKQHVCQCVTAIRTTDFSINGAVAESLCTRSNSLNEFLNKILELYSSG